MIDMLIVDSFLIYSSFLLTLKPNCKIELADSWWQVDWFWFLLYPIV